MEIEKEGKNLKRSIFTRAEEMGKLYSKRHTDWLCISANDWRIISSWSNHMVP